MQSSMLLTPLPIPPPQGGRGARAESTAFALGRLLRRRGLALADFVEMFLQRQLAQFVEGQAHEDADALIKHAVSVGEGERMLGLRSLRLGRIRQAPMGGHRLAGPDGAGLL